jgi:hypothetical protein
MPAPDSSWNHGAPSTRAVGLRGSRDAGTAARLAEIALPTGSRAPGAARMVVRDHLSGLVTQRVLRDAELLVSELVTNSLDHGELRDGDSVLVSVYLVTDKAAPRDPEPVHRRRRRP